MELKQDETMDEQNKLVFRFRDEEPNEEIKEENQGDIAGETQNTLNLSTAQDEQPVSENTQSEQSEWGKYADWNNQNSDPYVSTQTRMTKQEFYKQPEMKKIRNNINGSAIVCYICAGLTLLLNVFFLGNIGGIVDVLLIVGLGLGIQLGKSRVCAVILVAYAGINVLVTLITTGRLGGWLVLAGGIDAVIGTFQLQRAWEEYEATGKF